MDRVFMPAMSSVVSEPEPSPDIAAAAPLAHEDDSIEVEVREAPAMTPRSGLGWQRVTLKALVDGPLAAAFLAAARSEQDVGVLCQIAASAKRITASSSAATAGAS